MAADRAPVLAGVLRDDRRSLLLWSLAVGVVTSIYVSFYPAMGTGDEIQAFVANLPEGFAEAMGYDRMSTPAGYLRSTVYGLLAPILLSVFAISHGARLVAGGEEDGTLELELAAPLSRRRIFLERLLALWLDLVVLAVVVGTVTAVLVSALDMELASTGILAAATGLLLLVLGFGTIAFAIGAATGRRVLALGVTAGIAVTAFILDAIGPLVEMSWMTAVSPFSWYLGGEPLSEGFDLARLLLLAALPLVAAVAGLFRFDRRDLMV